MGRKGARSCVLVVMGIHLSGCRLDNYTTATVGLQIAAISPYSPRITGSEAGLRAELQQESLASQQPFLGPGNTSLAYNLCISWHTIPVLLSSEPMMTQIDRYQATFETPPLSTPARDYFDGPLLGNGDLGVVIGGSPEQQQFWISKCDFWRALPRYPLFTPVNIGWLELGIPALQGAKYYAEQILSTAEVRQTFTTDVTMVNIKAWTPAVENALLVELSCTGDPVEVSIGLNTREAPYASAAVGTTDQCLSLTRRFDSEELDWANEAAVALRVIGAADRAADRAADASLSALDDRPAESDGQPVISGPRRCFQLREGSPALIAVQVRTSHQSAAPLPESLTSVHEDGMAAPF